MRLCIRVIVDTRVEQIIRVIVCIDGEVRRRALHATDYPVCVVIALVIILHYARHACLYGKIVKWLCCNICPHVELLIVNITTADERLLIVVTE